MNLLARVAMWGLLLCFPVEANLSDSEEESTKESSLSGEQKEEDKKAISPIVQPVISIRASQNVSFADKPVVIDKRISPPEPDKDLREKYEAQQKAKATACVFDNPDTSLSNINL